MTKPVGDEYHQRSSVLEQTGMIALPLFVQGIPSPAFPTSPEPVVLPVPVQGRSDLHHHSHGLTIETVVSNRTRRKLSLAIMWEAFNSKR